MYQMPTSSKLAELHDRSGPWVTILTPLAGGGAPAKGDPTRFRNLVRQAEAELESRTENGDGRAIAERLRAIADDRSVFNAGAPGMVVFANAEGVQLWHLPETVQERAIVDERPHLESLLPIVSRPSHFYVVTLNLHGPGLFSCDRYVARPLPLPKGTPTRLEDAAGWDIEEQHLQYHDIHRGPTGPGGNAGNRPIYHSQGEGEDDRDVDIVKYVRAMDHAFWRAIPHHDAWVVLACDPKVEGIFRRLTRLPHVFETALHGNFEHEDAATIHEKAWALIGPRIEERVDADLERYLDLRTSGRTADRVEDIVPEACRGRVDTLLVCEGATVEGWFDEEEWEVHLQGGEGPTTDLLDRAASDTFLNQGAVHVLSAEQMPSESPIVAIYRW